MWPFRRKKLRPLECLPAEDLWTVAKGEHEGRPMFVRVNSSAKHYAGHPDLSIRLGIAIPCHAPNEHGLPTRAESKQLHEIEDGLFDALGASGRVVLIITTGGMREFVSYVRSSHLAEHVASQLRAATATHEVQHYVESDPTWAVYRQFT